MKKIMSVVLTLTMLFSLSIPSFALETADSNELMKDVGKYLYETVSNPVVSSAGGEWTVFGLARSEIETDEEYFEKYFTNLERYVTKTNGILHRVKYSEYSRVIIALSATGKDPSNVSGHNLVLPICDFEKTVYQGINGSIWALIALDCLNSDTDMKVKEAKEQYLNHILKNQTADGGWALSGDEADPDITAMALSALAKHRDRHGVETAIEKALLCLSQMQNENGSFTQSNTETSEGCAQVIVALCELGISPHDERFTKNGHTAFDAMMSCFIPSGGFSHTSDSSEINLMTTEQCFYALVAYDRFLKGKPSLFSMNDVTLSDNSDENAIGLPGKNPVVKKNEILSPGKKFEDVSDFKIETLASMGIINGKTANTFDPHGSMTRAEFATIITRALGLEPKEDHIFEDVKTGDWFSGFVCSAHSHGIIKGISETHFNPHGTITREQAGAMIERAARLCGAENNIDRSAARDILAGFSDYITVSEWAMCAMAFCYEIGIMPDDALQINPHEEVTRT
ncbi:MAG: S-layer homology domain-containing protein, partial [Clostridia bacterium]|nr:S-layer homology domain-containing protein [Clostridia bacterium]